ncbi:nuclear egress lamina protein-like protein [Phocid alphaherpesvirus 1]|uniref:Nuclear egress lamina protein-like protein n=1 Tax=Phocid alphaherpesvirus 1 TaxID=47418 RepID=A0A482F4J5_9ALPH|nr:nuclear egress lamina protein-like protein [Phocid alphaherpesvirus 1]QBN85152.1 nuclear egress lamina protein-like protein [Phocid alphaherpesvirus 1]UNP64249.1 nuclear egress lamina protein-like protein [Phocid alphaherpesvirus 1]
MFNNYEIAMREQDANIRETIEDLFNINKENRIIRNRKSTRTRHPTGLGIRRDNDNSTTKQSRKISEKPKIAALQERKKYSLYFNYVATSPSDELSTVRELVVPLVKTMTITLPFNLSQTVADNCLSLSAMGYYLGIGGYCPTCAVTGEPRLNRADRAALILAYVQQLNNIYEYRAFLASISSLGMYENSDSLPGLVNNKNIETILEDVLNQPELFFAYHVLKDGGLNTRVLFYHDIEFSGYMMYAIFYGKAIHLHYRLIDRLLAACPNYKIIAHVWQTMFMLIIRKEAEKQIDTEVPSVSATDIYCKMCDLNFDGELLLEYKKLYVTFEDFQPPH